MKLGDPTPQLQNDFSHTGENISKENFLVKSPERITAQEIKEEESHVWFSFASDERRVNVGYNHGRLFLEVEFYRDLPAELSQEEKEKFIKTTRVINGAVREVYVLRTENALEVDESVSYDPKDTGEFHAAKGLDYTEGVFEKYALEKPHELEQILKENLAHEELAQVIFQQVIGFIKSEKTVPLEIMEKIPPTALENIRTQIIERIMPKPEKIDAKKLAEIIQGKRIIFYTGAGISMPAGIPGMSELVNGLGIDTNKEVDEFTHGATTNPKAVMAKWEDFVSKMAKAEPTEAHYALTEIAEKIGCQIVTANTDTLHERSGIRAIHTIRQWQKLGIKPEWLKDIDIIVAIGLSSDTKGFLGWYKENNPSGKIIGADITDRPPSYLGNQDYFLQGNIQETLPELAKEITRELLVRG